MADITLYELLGITSERSVEIARSVRSAYSESNSPAEWLKRLVEEFGITPENAEIFACGWFAGRYAGVSEVFNVVSRKMDEMDKDRAKKVEKERLYQSADGYA